jgi:uncharacterized protein (TIGR00288 family)
MSTEHIRDVAVFIDFENVYVSVREKLDESPNFELIMDRCNDLGRVVIARAYADWYRYPRITSALYANGIEPIYVPTYYYDKDMGRTGRAIKNSVDMNLCVDAMKALFVNENLSKFVLITGDRDFIPLVNSIRQQGKEVIVIGIGGAASTHLAQSADEFVFYEQIVGKSSISSSHKSKANRSGTSSEPSPAKAAPPPAEPDIYETLIEAVHVVRERRYKDQNGRPFSKFKDFVVEAERRGKVQIYTSGTVSEVFLPGEDASKLSQFADLKEEPASSQNDTTPVVQSNGTGKETTKNTTNSSSSSSSSSRSRRRRRPRNQQRQETEQQQKPEPAAPAPAETQQRESETTRKTKPAAKTQPLTQPSPEQPLPEQLPPEQIEKLAELTDSTSTSTDPTSTPDDPTPTAAEEQFPTLNEEGDLLFNVDEAFTLSNLYDRLSEASVRALFDAPEHQESEPPEAWQLSLSEPPAEARTAEPTEPAEPAEPAEPTEPEPANHLAPAEGEDHTTPPETEQTEHTNPPDLGRIEATETEVIEVTGPTEKLTDDTSADSTEESDDADNAEGDIVFTDEEWRVFCVMMQDFPKPTSFGQIFDSLRELRNKQVITRTNEQLRSLIKQAINNGVLERSGRGKRVYYMLKQDHTNDNETKD